MRLILRFTALVTLAMLGFCLSSALGHESTPSEYGGLLFTALKWGAGFLGLCLACYLVLAALVWLLVVPTSAAVESVQNAVDRVKHRADARARRREMGTELLPVSAAQGRGNETSAATGPDEGPG